MNYTIEKITEDREWYKFTDINAKGEKLLIEVMKITCDLKNKNSIMNLWKKNGYIENVMPSYWRVQVYIEDSEGNCFGRYNPTIINGKINFEWLFEATEDNKQKLINEVYKRFSTATGKSATEFKLDKIKEYAKQYNLEIFKEIPEGYKKSKYYAPIGSVLITNGKSLLSRERKEALLLT